MSAHYAIYIVHQDKQAGPFTLPQLRQQVAAGNISRTALAWFQGAGEWKPLNELFPDGLEIEDAPPVTSSTGLSLVKEDVVPPPLPGSAERKWMGPSAGGGKLRVPGKEEKTSEESISTPAWEKQEAKRVRKRSGKGSGGSGVSARVIVIIVLLAAIYWVYNHG